MKVCILGAGGFIGTHLAIDLKNKGYYVIGCDLKYPEFSETVCDEFHIRDLRKKESFDIITSDCDMIYQLAADMGGAGYIFVGDNDSDIIHNSALINLNTVERMREVGIKNVFFSSSACIYPAYNQVDINNPTTAEDTAYPADPDSDYGFEKLFSERVYLAHSRNYGFNVTIARLHNVFGPLSCYDNGKEKVPAALCRKIIESDSIEVWGNGQQTRSFLYIDECILGIHKLIQSGYRKPVNLGSERLIGINDLAYLIASLKNKNITIKNISGPVGVMGRTSDNKLIKQVTGWKPEDNLEYGLINLYNWIESQIG